MSTFEQTTGRSKVSQLLQQIELAYKAAQRGLSGLAAGTARHDFITARMENIGTCHQTLKGLLASKKPARSSPKHSSACE